MSCLSYYKAIAIRNNIHIQKTRVKATCAKYPKSKVCEIEQEKLQGMCESLSNYHELILKECEDFCSEKNDR